ncbi:putative Zn(II)2Cys6 transcription factor [Xylogone sp. PMI_703]|nr:putative Zn(II)2Cys6 transcription factor [Xylogone sp. PMI_703]
MLETQSLKPARKGTKSCTECRRRKLRCIRTSESAQKCRRCEERGSECVAQTYSSQPRRRPGQSSRHRISQLESKVSTLFQAVHGLESKLGYESTQAPDLVPASPGSNLETDESDDNSSVSDTLATDPPSHLRALFQNDWLSMDTRRQDIYLQDRMAKASTHLLDVARQALQKLIPPRQLVSDIATSAARWLVLLHTLLPQPLAAQTYEDIVDSYEAMHSPDIDAIILASWLLTIALTDQQFFSQDRRSPSSGLNRHQSIQHFPRTVSDVVESTILPHDRLICTMKGLGMGMHFCRLQVSQGNFQKAWIHLRHFIAIATVMGLPRAYQTVQFNRAHGIDSDETQLQRAQLWESLCYADGLSATMNNLPPCINQFQRPRHQELVIDGVVQPRAYLCRLTDIMTKTQYRDDMNATRGPTPEVYATTLALDRQLRVLISQTPKSWWAGNDKAIDADRVVQFLHYCMLLRIHMSFAMRQDVNGEYTYSLLACKDACESVTQEYQILRQELPPGIFLAKTLDLQAFIATVILLLISYGSTSVDPTNLRINKVKTDNLVMQVITIMEEKCLDNSAATAIRSLIKLLQQEDMSSNTQELTLRVPLLGKVHVRRKSIPRAQGLNFDNQNSAPILSNTAVSWNPNEQANPQDQNLPTALNTDINMMTTFPTQTMQWDPFSWSIEDHYEDLLQDTLSSEEINQFALWPSILPEL